MSAIMKTEQAPETSAILSMVERAAFDPNFNIETFKQLVSMQERAMDRQAEQEFNAALNRAQSQMGRISTDASNSQTHSKYATYGKLDKALRPIYTQEGFSLSFGTGQDAPEGNVRVLCYVSHGGGHTRTYHADIPTDGKGAKGNDVMTKTHAVGSGMSYGMRYLLKMIFNVAIGEEDDDGNGANNPPYDIDSWDDAITDAIDMTELNKIGADLRSRNDIPANALRNIRALWAKRAKDLK